MLQALSRFDAKWLKVDLQVSLGGLALLFVDTSALGKKDEGCRLFATYYRIYDIHYGLGIRAVLLWCLWWHHSLLM